MPAHMRKDTRKDMTKNTNQPSPQATDVEWIKHESNALRGTISNDLADQATGSVSEANSQLIKFHGIYQQDNRDIRKQRAASKLEPDYSFMIRMRLPAGVIHTKQMESLVQIGLASQAASLKLTTRQSIQLHGIIKQKLRNTITEFHQQMLDSIAACGDVNRNVMCSPAPELHPQASTEIHHLAQRISEHLLPQSNAWHEIWINDSQLQPANTQTKEPLYGQHYLPRKFKIGIAVPPRNDIDVFSHDIGLVAVVDKDVFIGCNVFVGGGLGVTHGNSATKALLAQPFGFCPPEALLSVCEAILLVQRDHGNRNNRALARTKYTLRHLGKESFLALVEQHAGYQFEPLKEYHFTATDDQYGWHTNGTHCSRVLCVENGRLKDQPNGPSWLSALLALAQSEHCTFQVTPNQNIMVHCAAEKKDLIQQIIDQHDIENHQQQLSRVRQLAMACTAFNSCTLAMAEAERYLPTLLGKVETLLQRHQLDQEAIVIRMTGCPNGCARSRLAEIGFVGKSLNRYQMFVGASPQGDRLNRLYKDNLDETSILTELDLLFSRFVDERNPQESFGDFADRVVLSGD